MNAWSLNKCITMKSIRKWKRKNKRGEKGMYKPNRSPKFKQDAIKEGKKQVCKQKTSKIDLKWKRKKILEKKSTFDRRRRQKRNHRTREKTKRQEKETERKALASS